MPIIKEYMNLPEPAPTDISDSETDGTFDVDAARRAGYSFTDIADYLAKDDEFDLKGAREAGHDDAEIVSYLTRGKGFSLSGGPAHAALRGVYGSAADMVGLLGAPGDAANWAMRKMGVDVEPSDYMGAPRRALSKLPTPSGGTQWTYEELADLPPGERPFAVGGEVVGASIPIAGAPLAAARAGAKGPKMLKPVMDAARTKPGQFAIREAGSIAGAAQLGGAAEAIRPGDPVARFAGEAAGAFVNPVGQAARVVGGSARKAKQVAQGYTQAGREIAAADTLQGALREAGEDPAAVARTLAEPDVTLGVEGLTAGQKTGSPTLLAVEANLAKRSPHFAGEARKAADEGLESLRTAIDDLVRSGDPESLQRAAQLREAYFSQLLDRRVTTALRKAEEAGTRVPQRGRSQTHDPSIEAEQALQEALSDARSVESQLWGAIDRRVPIRPEGLQAAHAEVRQQLLKEESLDGVTEQFLRRTAPLEQGKAGPGTPTSAEMLRFRKHLLAQARQQEARNNPDIARMYETLARGVLNDLDQVPGSATQTARQYSKALNDTFTRTFAGEAMATRTTGAQIIPPETLLERAFGARGGSEADVRFRQMVEAAGFGPNDLSPRMADAQERFVRVMAAETRDKAGRVDPNKLQSFMADNANMLERFPGLQDDLADVASAERLFRETEAATAHASKAIRNKAAFSRLVQAEDPARVVGEALADRRAPGRAYHGLVKVAKRGGDNAVAGLKSATLEHAARQATNPDGGFSFARYSQAMEGGPRQRGLLDLMESRGVMSNVETTRMRKLVDEAQKIETALTTRERIDELVDAPDALMELVLRISGARLGTMVSSNQAVGHGLIAAHAGSRFMRQLFDKVPRTRVMDVLEAASRDRKLMTALLTKPTTQAQAKAFERQINAALIQAGITHDIEQDDLPMESGFVSPEMQRRIDGAVTGR